jgi:glycosyltransferase involved in cell wall biosynthesis
VTDLPVVLFLHPSDELYGADRSLRSLVLAVTDLVHPVVVLPDDLPYRGELSASLRSSGVEVVIGPLPVVRRRYLDPIRVAPWIVRTFLGTVWLTVLARRRRAVAVISNTTAVIGGPVAARLVDVPHLWYVREIIESPPWYRAFVCRTARIARGQVIAVSRAVAEWLGDLAEHGPVVMHNGVDVFGDPLTLPDAPRAVFVGRFNGWKGQETFIDAAFLAHERVPTATFALVGGAVPADHTTARAVEERARSIDPAGGWLQLVGELGDSREAMRQAWLVAVPSTLPDPFPNVVLEAMAEGRAVVGSDLGGIPEMVGDGRTGRLVAPGNAEQLAESLVRILTNRDLAESMGRAGRVEIDLRFSREHFRSKWRALLLSTLQAKGPE